MDQELAWCPLAQMADSGITSIREALGVVDFTDEVAKRGTSNRTYFVRHRHSSAV